MLEARNMQQTRAGSDCHTVVPMGFLFELWSFFLAPRSWLEFCTMYGYLQAEILE